MPNIVLKGFIAAWFVSRVFDKYPRRRGAWTATAMSDDGSVIVVTSSDAEISTSADGGQNWVEETGIAMRFEAAASRLGTTVASRGEADYPKP